VSDRELLLVAAVVLVAGMAGIVIGLVSCQGDEQAALPTGNDVELLNDTVIRDGAMTWQPICTPAHERFCPPPSQRQGE
jgi:hypothetical protein